MHGINVKRGVEVLNLKNTAWVILGVGFKRH
jgi:hypothetical protein